MQLVCEPVGRAWELRLGHEVFRLQTVFAEPPTGSRRCTRERAAREVERALLGPEGLRLAARMSATLLHEPHIEAVLARERVVRALASGRLALWQRTRGAELLRLDEAEERVETRRRKAEVALTWVEIELLDEIDQPVPGERYLIEFFDGSAPRSGRLDDRGLAFVDGIPPGKCSVSFPEYDGGAWRHVATSPDPRSRRRPA
jgi:hypothetical protein